MKNRASRHFAFVEISIAHQLYLFCTVSELLHKSKLQEIQNVNIPIRKLPNNE